jgi:hypothetical protein
MGAVRRRIAVVKRKKSPDQIASEERMARMQQEAAQEWDALVQSPLGQHAVEAWARKNPDGGYLTREHKDPDDVGYLKWVPTGNPRWMIGMAYCAFVKRFVREHSEGPQSDALGTVPENP